MASKIVVYHYPKCKKSRAGLEYVRSLGVEPMVVNYVEEGLTEQELTQILAKLRVTAFEMIRQQEEYYRETLKNQEISEEQWVKILVENPRLLKRPVVVTDDGAALADPPQNVNKLLTAYIK